MTKAEGGRELPGHIPLQDLRRRLRDSNPPYQLITPLTADLARFYFVGPFEGREIVWNATLMTLEHYVHQGCQQARYRADETIQLQQFIEISEETIEPLPILIVHDIPCVDAGRVLKTVLMIRNYKRLHRGQHPYGESHSFVIERRED